MPQAASTIAINMIKGNLATAAPPGIRFKESPKPYGCQCKETFTVIAGQEFAVCLTFINNNAGAIVLAAAMSLERTATVKLSCPSCGAKGQARAALGNGNKRLSILEMSRLFRLMRIDYTLEDTRFGCPECKIPVKAVIDLCEATAAPCK
jgi:hypothetical protein